MSQIKRFFDSGKKILEHVFWKEKNSNCKSVLVLKLIEKEAIELNFDFCVGVHRGINTFNQW